MPRPCPAYDANPDFQGSNSPRVQIAKALLYDDLHPEGSMPIKILPIAGDEAVKTDIEGAIEEAQGLIFAFDSDKQFLPDAALDVFLPAAGGTQVKSI